MGKARNFKFIAQIDLGMNSLPVHIRTTQSHSAFCRHLKTRTLLFAN